MVKNGTTGRKSVRHICNQCKQPFKPYKTKSGRIFKKLCKDCRIRINKESGIKRRKDNATKTTTKNNQ